MPPSDRGRHVRYRPLKGYKYQLLEPYAIGVELRIGQAFKSPYLSLTTDGELTIEASYAWDGPSGPTIDTKTFLRGSLVHDALYQLMRMSVLDLKEHRHYADDLLRKMCIEDGMFWFRAWYVHAILRLFGARNARPQIRKNEVSRLAP